MLLMVILSRVIFQVLQGCKKPEALLSLQSQYFQCKKTDIAIIVVVWEIIFILSHNQQSSESGIKSQSKKGALYMIYSGTRWKRNAIVYLIYDGKFENHFTHWEFTKLKQWLKLLCKLRKKTPRSLWSIKVKA